MNIVEVVTWLNGGDDRSVSLNGRRAVLNRSENGLIWVDTKKEVKTRLLNSNDWQKIEKAYRHYSKDTALQALIKGHTIRVTPKDYGESPASRRRNSGITFELDHSSLLIRVEGEDAGGLITLNRSEDERVSEVEVFFSEYDIWQALTYGDEGFKELSWYERRHL